ncbi:MAG TPA: 16S rRNA (uracil(1498)-N(3))-methyltransferase, partial [Prochlorococcus sp.]
PNEESSAEGAGWVPVGLGDSILRTCTAAVAATQTMVSTRRIRVLREGQVAID